MYNKVECSCLTLSYGFGLSGRSQRKIYDQRYYFVFDNITSNGSNCDIIIYKIWCQIWLSFLQKDVCGYLVIKMNLFAQYNFKVNRPLVPPLIHDDTTRIIVVVLGILICGLITYKFMRYFNEL